MLFLVFLLALTIKNLRPRNALTTSSNLVRKHKNKNKIKSPRNKVSTATDLPLQGAKMVGHKCGNVRGNVLRDKHSQQEVGQARKHSHHLQAHLPRSNRRLCVGLHSTLRKIMHRSLPTLLYRCFNGMVHRSLPRSLNFLCHVNGIDLFLLRPTAESLFFVAVLLQLLRSIMVIMVIMVQNSLRSIMVIMVIIVLT